MCTVILFSRVFFVHFYVYPVIRKVSINLSFAIADLSFFSGTLSFFALEPWVFLWLSWSIFPKPKLGKMGKIMSILRAVGTFYDLVPTIFQRLATNTGNGVAGKLRKPEFLSKIPEFFGKPEFFRTWVFSKMHKKKPALTAHPKIDMAGFFLHCEKLRYFPWETKISAIFK